MPLSMLVLGETGVFARKASRSGYSWALVKRHKLTDQQSRKE